LLACVGLLNQRPVSAHAIEQTLAYALNVPVAVIPFVGRWLSLDEHQTTVLGQLGRNTALGSDTVIGSKVWDHSAAIRVELGPMTLPQMRRLLPGAPDHGALSTVLEYALGDSVAVDVKLTLGAKQVPVSRLWAKTPSRLPRLGWTSWLTSRPRHEPGEVVLRLASPDPG
jgi:type VI secretion system protein ImpH